MAHGEGDNGGGERNIHLVGDDSWFVSRTSVEVALGIFTEDKLLLRKLSAKSCFCLSRTPARGSRFVPNPFGPK